MPNKVLIVVGDATETVDTLYPFLRVQEEGFQSVVAGPERRRYNMVMHEHTAGWDITREWEGYKIDADIAFRDIDPAEYVGIFFSGGRAPEYIRDDPDLIRVTQHFFEKDKPVASVCHGVEIPARAGCVKDRRMTCVPKCRFDLEVCGGIYVDAPFCIDRNLVSGRFWNHHHLYMKAWIGLMEAERNAVQKRAAA
jgi:protease I